MKILNNQIPHIITYDRRNPTITYFSDHTAALLTVIEEKSLDCTFWYCMFSCEKSFEIYSIKSMLDEKTFKKICKKKFFLVLENTLEPFTSMIDSIYNNIVIKENIPASQIIFLTNIPDAREYSDRLAEKLNLDKIQILWCSIFEKSLQEAVLHIYKGNLPKTLIDKTYTKKFLCFNRRWRLHRPFLITLLFANNLLHEGYISLGPCENNDNWDYRWKELKTYFRNNKEVLDELQQYHAITKLPPMYLDTDELEINRATSTVDTNRYYEDTYFSVVTETTYFTKNNFDNTRFPSEKIFKPIAMKHPFILVSVPNSLELLKTMGYKTFSSIIDESYDQEVDDFLRMKKIVNEINRLTNLNKKDLSVFLQEARNICEFNFNVLMTKTKFISEI